MPADCGPTGYGYRARLWAPLTPGEATRWVAEVTRLIDDAGAFSQMIDTRDLAARGDRRHDPRIGEVMGHALTHGLVRSAVIVPNTFHAVRLAGLAWNVGLYARERYIDGGDPDWERTALDWVERGVDPQHPPDP